MNTLPVSVIINCKSITYLRKEKWYSRFVLSLSARYFVWREDSTILKAKVNDRDYAECINEFKKADILYIDDLFKQKISRTPI